MTHRPERPNAIPVLIPTRTIPGLLPWFGVMPEPTTHSRLFNYARTFSHDGAIQGRAERPATVNPTGPSTLNKASARPQAGPSPIARTSLERVPNKKVRTAIAKRSRHEGARVNSSFLSPTLVTALNVRSLGDIRVRAT